MRCITFIKIVQSAYTVYSLNFPLKSRKSKTSNGGLGYNTRKTLAGEISIFLEFLRY